MAKTNQGNIEKNLISRRTLLSNSLWTGLSIATGFYLTNSSNIQHKKINGSDLNIRSSNDLVESGKKLKEETYIDNFDC